MSGSPRILGVTLARSGSKGVPGKNTKLLCGKPLIAHTIKEALQSSLLTDYVVSTDSQEVANLSKRLGADVPFIRPQELAQDNSSSVSALKHAVNEMELLRKFKYDFVVELMVTNPFKTTFDIDTAIRSLIESGADSVIAVKRVTDGHPARIKKLVGGRIEDFCVPEELESRRQDLKPDAFIRCGAIYALTRSELMDRNRRYGSSFSLAMELAFTDSVNIDDENDFALAEILMTREFQNG